MMGCAGVGWCAGKNVFPSLMHAGMQLSVVGVGLPGLTGCTLPLLAQRCSAAGVVICLHVVVVVLVVVSHCYH